MYRLTSCLAVLVMLAGVGLARADDLVVPLTDSGWYDAEGHHPTGGNYIVGDYSDGMNHRNWFLFDLSDIEMTIGRATLRAYNNGEGYASPDPTETWTLFDVSTNLISLVSDTGGNAAWVDLGTGIVYGSTTVSPADNNTVVEVSLNSDALAALNGTSEFFAIGGTLTTLSSPSKEVVFSSSGSGPVELVLEPIIESPNSVPEASTRLPAFPIRRQRFFAS